MPNTLIPIQTYTLTSSASSITFSNIPQNYTDLKIVVSGRDSTYGADTSTIYFKFNNDATNQNHRRLFNNGGTVGNGTLTILGITNMNGTTSTSNTFSNGEVYIPNYTSSNFKSLLVENVMENFSATVYSGFLAGLWSNTAAITSVNFTCDGSFATGSTFTLYGVSNGVKATGGTLTVAGGYAYHTFTSTGSFLPSQKITGAEVLIVAGGGGGSVNEAGGGGAGGLLNPVSQTLNAGNTYTAAIGAGGATASTNGVRGSSSIFSTFTTVGGGGGGNGGVAGASGGSGGGGGAYGSNAGGTPTVGQGFAGGIGSVINGGAAGGGGAGEIGTNGTATTAGNGGNGLIFNSWGSVTGTGQLVGGVYYYAGGGGGGAFTGSTQSRGGYGGGGAGGAGTPTVGTAGTANTGGGGGGGGTGGTIVGGAGGSGIIIIRYPLS
jgi:hypothetical protein